jgi:hypothetical protein
MSDDESKDQSKARGGFARADVLPPARRSEIAKAAAMARWADDASIPQATHEGTLTIGNVEIACAVLENGQRVITQSGFMRALGRARQAKGRGYYDGDVNMPAFLTAKNLKPFISKELEVTSSQIEFRLKGRRAFGYPADLLPKVCDVFLDAKAANALIPQQEHIAAKAQILIRGLAHVGILALVDEATGYQRDRAPDALAKILEAFITKELQPWLHTFPDEFYEHLFRLRGLDYPHDTPKRPQYFGHLTNDIVYRRIAPGVLEELKRTTPKRPSGRLRHHLHRRLTSDLGHPKLREHMASVVTIMKLSDKYQDFKDKLDRIHPAYNETMALDFDHGDGGDDEPGL